MKKNCPVCNSPKIESLYRSQVPVLQNRVYKTELDSKKCITGTVDLTHCLNCNFTFNASFDNQRIVYDENYDNAVPSQLFTTYYQNICKYIYEKYNLEDGIIYDIGCGKGTFLMELCKLYPKVKGIGIDPSYEGELNPLQNLVFIQDLFKQEHVLDKPSLILSRHVFEHIEFPKDFLQIIRNPTQSFSDIPVFIEVPDFAWIVNNKTFWDICYEHCNYFSMNSIETMFDNPWSTLTTITPSFGNQYLWIEGVFNIENNKKESSHYPPITKESLDQFINSIKKAQYSIKQTILDYRQLNYKIIVWGMATKGVIFTNNIDQEKLLVDYCIDINKEKQNKYSPVSGHLIQDPETLKAISGQACLIIVMNTNYIDEIKSSISEMNINGIFINAHSEKV